MYVKGCCLRVCVSQVHVLSPNIQCDTVRGGAQRGTVMAGAQRGTVQGGAQHGTVGGGALKEDLGP